MPPAACRLLVIFQKFEDEHAVDDTEYPGVCVKISESGMVMMTPLPLAGGRRLLVRVNPADLAMGKIICRIEDITEFVQQKKLFFEYRLGFVNVRDCDRSTISAYVYGVLAENI